MPLRHDKMSAATTYQRGVNISQKSWGILLQSLQAYQHGLRVFSLTQKCIICKHNTSLITQVSHCFIIQFRSLAKLVCP